MLAVRSRHQLTQAQVAKRLGISRRYVGYLERGERGGDVELATRFYAAFGAHLPVMAGLREDALEARRQVQAEQPTEPEAEDGRRRDLGSADPRVARQAMIRSAEVVMQYRGTPGRRFDRREQAMILAAQARRSHQLDSSGSRPVPVSVDGWERWLARRA